MMPRFFTVTARVNRSGSLDWTPSKAITFLPRSTGPRIQMTATGLQGSSRAWALQAREDPCKAVAVICILGPVDRGKNVIAFDGVQSSEPLRLTRAVTVKKRGIIHYIAHQMQPLGGQAFVMQVCHGGLRRR